MVIWFSVLNNALSAKKAALVTGSLSFSVMIPVQGVPVPVRRYPDVAAVFLPYAREAMPGSQA